MTAKRFYAYWNQDEKSPRELGAEWYVAVVSPNQTFIFPGHAIGYLSIMNDSLVIGLLDGTSRFNFPFSILQRVEFGDAVGFYETITQMMDFLLNLPEPEEQEEEAEEE